MQNVDRMRELFKLAAREAKTNRSANCTILEQVRFILLVSGKQAKARREFSLALDYHLTWCVCKASSSLREAWASLQPLGEHEANSTEETPASNTGVTDPSAAVPLDYFTGGK